MSSLVSKNGLQLLQQYLESIPNITSSQNIHDIVFIAIDFESLENLKHGPTQDLNSEVGVAIFDTRNLLSPPRPAISTFNFVIGSPSYCDRCAKRFLFGRTIRIRQEDICRKLETLISRERNNVLVGHGFAHDVKILEFLKFDTCSSVIGILDTQRIAAEIAPHACASLRDILIDLKCPFTRLHNAGNDAHFTLQALLSFATKNHPFEFTANRDIQNKLTLLRAISKMPIPKGGSRQAKRKVKMEDRVQRSRKSQARLWTAETIEQIRKERRERGLNREGDWECDATVMGQMRAEQDLEKEGNSKPDDNRILRIRTERKLKRERDIYAESIEDVALLFPNLHKQL